jgi:putative endonuclease
MDKRKEIGDFGEIIALDYLKNNKYKILEQNYRKRGGEIDIIALKDDILVFFEVKTASKKMIEPLLWIDDEQLKRIIDTSNHYITDNYDTMPQCRFDIIIIKKINKDSFNLEHIPDAFRDEYEE